MIARLKLLSGLLLLCLIPAGCGTVSSSSSLPDLYITAKFVNNSGLNSGQIHVTLNGYDRSGNWGFFDLSQEPAVFKVTNNIGDVPDVTLDTLVARGGVTVPYVSSGRIYLAVGQRIGAEVNDYNHPTCSTSTLYDKFELTVKETGNVVNLTQVDYFAFPLKLTSSSETRGFCDGVTRKQIFDAYAADTKLAGDWQKLVIKDSGGNNLRILNPAKIADADKPLFGSLPTYWDTIIAQYWAAGNTVKVKSNETPYPQLTGTADGGKIDFGSSGIYGKPTSIQMFGQEVAAGWDPKLVKWVSCAVNRGVIGNSNVNDQGDSGKFYSASGATYNRYAEFFHNAAYTISAEAYALAFDDVFGFDSALGIPNKGEVTIQLQAFQ